MKNTVVCKICNVENPFYNFTCKNCKGFLRDKISNINFWFVISKLFESPVTAFKTILYSEHKNFMFLLSFLIAIKMTLQSIFISIFVLGKPGSDFNNIIIYSTVLIFLTPLILYFFSWLLRRLLAIFNLESRVKDNYSIIVYSLVGYVFSLIVLFPIELILFGKSLFQSSPSPFFLKPFSAYLMVAFESLFFLWSLFLTNRAIFTQSNKILFSFILSLIIHMTLYALPIIIWIPLHN